MGRDLFDDPAEFFDAEAGEGAEVGLGANDGVASIGRDLDFSLDDVAPRSVEDFVAFFVVAGLPLLQEPSLVFLVPQFFPGAATILGSEVLGDLFVAFGAGEGHL